MNRLQLAAANFSGGGTTGAERVKAHIMLYEGWLVTDFFYMPASEVDFIAALAEVPYYRVSWYASQRNYALRDYSQ